jgi:hypothetical protein
VSEADNGATLRIRGRTFIDGLSMANRYCVAGQAPLRLNSPRTLDTRYGMRGSFTRDEP